MNDKQLDNLLRKVCRAAISPHSTPGVEYDYFAAKQAVIDYFLAEALKCLPTTLPSYQQETERTKREKAYYNKAIDEATKRLKERFQ